MVLRGAVGALGPGLVARPLKVEHGPVRHAGAGEVVGQQLGRRPRGAPFERLGNPAVQHRPPRRPHLGLHHLADDVVREHIGVFPLFQQQPRPASRLQARHHRLLRLLRRRRQQRPRRPPSHRRRGAKDLLTGRRQQRHPLPYSLCQVPGHPLSAALPQGLRIADQEERRTLGTLQHPLDRAVISLADVEQQILQQRRRLPLGPLAEGELLDQPSLREVGQQQIQRVRRPHLGVAVGPDQP